MMVLAVVGISVSGAKDGYFTSSLAFAGLITVLGLRVTRQVLLLSIIYEEIAHRVLNNLLERPLVGMLP